MEYQKVKEWGPRLPIPCGTIFVYDPTPLNWLYVLFNTMEEPVRADREGHLVPSLTEDWKWLSDNILQLSLRRGVRFHNNEVYTAHLFKRNFEEVMRWVAPHPPGTWLNFPRGTTMEIVDDYTVNLDLPYPDGLLLGKSRAFHQGNKLFWEKLGFGYYNLGTGEGRW